MHSHHAFQLTLAAGGRADIRTEAGLLKGPVVLVAPGPPPRHRAEGRIALLFVEPESRAGAGLRRLLQDRPAARLPPMPEVVLTSVRSGALRDLLTTTWRTLVARSWTASLLRKNGRWHWTRALRACSTGWRVLARRASRPHRPLLWRASLRAASAIFSLGDRAAVPHLRALAPADAGGGPAAAGDSLTSAAHQAGFSDSAHFSRTFHRMFGMPADSLWLRPREDA
jgi:AraC-like DNA-binding protein